MRSQLQCQVSFSYDQLINLAAKVKHKIPVFDSQPESIDVPVREAALTSIRPTAEHGPRFVELSNRRRTARRPIKIRIVQRAVKLIQPCLCCPQSVWTFGCQRGTEGLSLGQHSIIAGCNMCRQTESMRDYTADELATHEQCTARAAANRLMQRWNRYRRRNTNPMNRIPQLRLSRDNHKIARAQQRTSPRNRRPLHRRHHDLRHPPQRAQNPAQSINELRHQIRISNRSRQIKPRAKHRPFPTQQHNVN